MLISIQKRFYDPNYIEYHSVDTINETINIIKKFSDHNYHIEISATTPNEIVKLVSLSYELDALDISHQLKSMVKI